MYSVPRRGQKSSNHLKAVKPERVMADLSFKKCHYRDGARGGEVCYAEVNFRLISQSLN